MWSWMSDSVALILDLSDRCNVGLEKSRQEVVLVLDPGAESSQIFLEHSFPLLSFPSVLSSSDLGLQFILPSFLSF